MLDRTRHGTVTQSGRQ